MREALSNIPESEYDPNAEFEQLADWLIRYEASQSEKSRRLPLFEVAAEGVENTATELMFERRHEVKDESRSDNKVRAWRGQPMIPISQVLQVQPFDNMSSSKATVTASQPVIVQKQLQKVVYGRSIRYGFSGGVILVLTIAIVSLLR